VKDYPKLRTTRELKGFLCLAGYYRKFIPNFIMIAKPLTGLLKQNTPFIWNDETGAAFATEKRY